MLSTMFHHLYRLLISVKLAVALIIVIMAVLAAGTLIESLQGAAAAKIIVYNSLWFSILILFLSLNVFAVALSRLPWKKKHLGFVMTHLGILMLLGGALVSRYYMIDGQVAIAKGETESFITLPEPLVQVQSPDKGKLWAFRLPQKAFAWEGDEAFGEGRGPFSFELLNFYPKAEVVERYTPAPNGSPAVLVKLHGGISEQEKWLVQGDPHKGTVEMGPARVILAKELITPPAEDPTTGDSMLTFEIGGGKVSVPVTAAMTLPATFPLENTEYTVTLLEVFRHGVVAEGKLIDQASNTGSDAWVNPAVKLRLEGAGVAEDHTAFAKFPDFPTLHGQEPKPSGVKVGFHVPGVEAAEASDREVRVVLGDGGKPRIQMKHQGKLQTMEVTPGEPLTTDWKGISLEVAEYIPKAEKELVFTPLPNISEQDGAVSAVRLAISGGGEKHVVWLRLGTPETVKLNGEPYLVAYTMKRIPLGFKLKLVNFVKADYPGTRNPASFSSDVVLTDAMQGVTEEAHISMNEPLDYRGFKIYQSGYIQGVGEPDVSIFAVSRNPGIWLTYLGSLVMVLGIVVMIIARKQVRS